MAAATVLGVVLSFPFVLALHLKGESLTLNNFENSCHKSKKGFGYSFAIVKMRCFLNRVPPQTPYQLNCEVDLTDISQLYYFYIPPSSVPFM